MLFSLYVSDVIALVLGLDLGVHMYVDDFQIYLADYFANMSTIADCVVVVGMWLLANRLMFNPLETNFFG